VEYKLQSENFKQFHVAYAGREVVLTCGTVSTPHLLLRSGVGPKNHLREFNIPLIRYLFFFFFLKYCKILILQSL
jgi:choline dehydrogenase-like flavoprotein